MSLRPDLPPPSQPPAPRPRRIAVEEAFVTPAIQRGWEQVLQSHHAEPGFKLMGASILGRDPGAQAIHRRLLDIGPGRLAQMDADGIDLALLSITSPGVQVFDAITAAALAREANDVLAAAVSAHPGRLAGLACVAPQHAVSAAHELQRAVQTLGLRGWIVNSHTHGQYLDDIAFRPLLEAAAALKTPLYLHPREPAPALIGPMQDHGLYFAGWGFAVETATHAMRLIMSGTLDALPDLHIVLGHMGEGLPFWLQRIDNRYQLQVKIGAVKPLKRLPSEVFLQQFSITTSGVMSVPALRMALDVLGPERILFAADYPYESVADGVRFLDTAPIDDAVRQQIYAGNAQRVFGLG